MADLIDRDSLIDFIMDADSILNECLPEGEYEPLGDAFCEVINVIRNAKPVVHGYWIMQKHDIYTTCACSQCGTEFEWSLMTYHYCPNCGAKMDGGSKDD